MCDGDCTHGQCVYIPPGHTYATWPTTDETTTAAIQTALTNQGITRGSD